LLTDYLCLSIVNDWQDPPNSIHS